MKNLLAILLYGFILLQPTVAKADSCVDEKLTAASLGTGILCTGTIGLAVAACPVYVTTGGIEPVSGSTCALAMSSAALFCKASVVTVTVLVADIITSCIF